MQSKQLQTKLLQWKAACLITHNAQIAWFFQVMESEGTQNKSTLMSLVPTFHIPLLRFARGRGLELEDL